ncbi:rCG52435 [Rattus norvegicus]|uniref:RCG52435 n=1 Tax=Rattus norvegicus TaxID=10116 RepID=A6K109_RAT|nr:rCG52435 [Rattus norvegicus]
MRKQTRIAILIIDRIDFKLKLIRKDRERHFILVKGPIKKEKLQY